MTDVLTSLISAKRYATYSIASTLVILLDQYQGIKTHVASTVCHLLTHIVIPEDFVD